MWSADSLELGALPGSQLPRAVLPERTFLGGGGRGQSTSVPGAGRGNRVKAPPFWSGIGQV